MKMTEFRQYLKAMDSADKDALILELYKRENKKDRELIELIMTGLRENKELPSPKAVIPDLKTGRKKIDEWSSRMYVYPGWRRGRMRARFKTEAKAYLKDLCAIPARAQGYEEACAQLKDLFYVLSVGKLGCYPWGDPFSELNTSQKDVFRDLCALLLARGSKISVFQQLIDILVDTPVELWADLIELAEVLLIFTRNGDLRGEIVWMLEDRLSQLQNQSTRQELQPQQESSRARQMRLSMVYLVFASSVESEQQALLSLERLLKDEDLASQVQSRWSSAKQTFKEQEAEAIGNALDD